MGCIYFETPCTIVIIKEQNLKAFYVKVANDKY